MAARYVGHEPESIHGKGTRGPRRRATARRRDEPRPGGSRARARHPGRAARRRRPQRAVEDERRCAAGGRVGARRSRPPAAGARRRHARDLSAPERDRRDGAGRGRADEGRVRQHRAPAAGAGRGRRARRGVADPAAAGGDVGPGARGARVGPRVAAGDRPEPGRQVPGARTLRPGPDRSRAQGEARPGHRARRRDPPRDPGAVTAHQEQSRLDRRAGCREDGRRGRPGPPHREAGRAGRPEGQADRRARPRRPGRRRQVPRGVRRTTEGRAEGDRRRGRTGDPLHRRTAHRRRRGGGRGLDRRLEHAETDARPRRAAHDRGHDARRVPEVHREGRGAGAAVPAGPGRRADGRGYHQHPPRAPRALRDPPRRDVQGRRAGVGGAALRALHRGPLPARQGHRPDGRGGVEAADGDRFDARGARRGRAPDHAARDRGRSAAQGAGQGLVRAAGAAAEGAGRPQGRAHAAGQPLAAGEGRDPGGAPAEGGAGAAARAVGAGAAGRRLRQGVRTPVPDASPTPSGASRPPKRVSRPSSRTSGC